MWEAWKLNQARYNAFYFDECVKILYEVRDIRCKDTNKK